MTTFTGFEHGIGIGGWLTNYKRLNVVPEDRRLIVTVGDMEHFDSYITERDVAYIASLGFDHIRLAFDQIVLESGDCAYNPHIFDLMEQFVLWCRKYGLNVVLNLHKAVGNYCDISDMPELLENDELQQRFIDLWTAMEQRFSAYPDVAFELLNEMRSVNPSLWNNLANRTIHELRKLNPTRKLIVGSTCWNSPGTLRYLDIDDDDNVIYTFHMYDPHEFTHQQGVLQSGPAFYNRKMPYPGDIERYKDYQRTVNHAENPYSDYDRMDKNYLYDRMQGALDFIQAHPDRVLWLGEFGTIRHAKISWRESYMKDVISFCKINQIPYCVWNYLSTPYDGNRFSLVDDDRREILSSELAKILIGDFAL